MGALTRLGKAAVVVGDGPGFVANRIQFAMFREAARIVEDGLATPEQVDEVVRSSFGFRLPFFGPFTIADLAGLDVYADIYETLERGLGPGFSAPGAPARARRAGATSASRRGVGSWSMSQEEADELLARRDRAYAGPRTAPARGRGMSSGVLAGAPDAAARRPARDRDRSGTRHRPRRRACARRGGRGRHALLPLGGGAGSGGRRGGRARQAGRDLRRGRALARRRRPPRRDGRRQRRPFDLRHRGGDEPPGPDARAADRRLRPRRRDEPPRHVPHLPGVRRRDRLGRPRRADRGDLVADWERSATPGGPRTARASTP